MVDNEIKAMDERPLVLELDTADALNGFLGSLCQGGRSYEVVLSQGDNSAKIYINKARILWAIASGQSESFQNTLIDAGISTRDDLLDAIQRSRRQGKRDLDEILQSVGVDDRDYRESIIEQHTRAAFNCLFSWGATTARVQPIGEIASTHPGFAPTAFIETPNHTAEEAPPLPAPEFSPEELTIRDPAEFAVVGVGSHEEHLAEEAQLKPESDQLRSSASEIQPAPTPVIPPPVEAIPPQQTQPNSRSADTLEHGLQQILASLEQEIPSLISAILIDGMTGMPIVHTGHILPDDVDRASAYGSALTRSAKEAAQATADRSATPSGRGTEVVTPEELFITTNDQFILLSTIKSVPHLLMLSIARDSNPGLARVVAKKRARALSELFHR